MLAKSYIFQSARLGFRCWEEADLDQMSAINANEAVMEFFPSTQQRAQTAAFIARMQLQWEAKAFCYFAVERLDQGALIGFIGLSEQTFEASFTPCVDIGWRLHPDAWGQGFASEGAQRCLEYGFGVLQLQKIYATAPTINLKSIRVMEKIGMQYLLNFQHPLLLSDTRLKDCVLYEATKPV